MNRKVDLFDGMYSQFEAEVHARVRQKTFDEDFGQNSWTSADEFRRWVDWLDLSDRSNVLEVASGSGGPAVHLAELSGARVTGIDVNAHGVAAARRRAQAHGLADRVTFKQLDAGATLPFPAASFDAVVCIDSACHFADRRRVLEEWRRLLEPGGKALYTDPVVLTGPVSNEELATRSSVGFFLFAPPGWNERWIESAGLRLVRQADATDNVARVAQRWHVARAEDEAALVQLEGAERYANLQEFFAIAHRLASERRLSRLVYLAEKR